MPNATFKSHGNREWRWSYVFSTVAPEFLKSRVSIYFESSFRSFSNFLSSGILTVKPCILGF